MRYRFGTKKRDELWSREAAFACQSGLGHHPICNLCDRPVLPGDAWDESHCPSRPKAFGGRSTGIAHRKCNRDHGAQVVVPAVAKAERVRKAYLGITGPGLGRAPMRAGRRSDETKTMNHGVCRRVTGAARHRQFLLNRYGFLPGYEAELDAVDHEMRQP